MAERETVICDRTKIDLNTLIKFLMICATVFGLYLSSRVHATPPQLLTVEMADVKYVSAATACDPARGFVTQAEYKADQKQLALIEAQLQNMDRNLADLNKSIRRHMDRRTGDPQ